MNLEIFHKVMLSQERFVVFTLHIFNIFVI
nr:MAG TPA: hypothetical protein [Caudoviricetes sp.]